MNVELLLTGAGLAVELYQIAESKIRRYREIQKEYAKRLSALRREVRNNLEIVNKLIKGDTGAQAIYDPAIRKALNALRYKELQAANNAFDPIVGKHLKKGAKKKADKKDPLRIFWNIYDTYRKMETLSARLKRAPAKYSVKAPRILLTRRLPALQKRLAEIDEALKIIPVKKL
jgi:hypothetical protein